MFLDAAADVVGEFAVEPCGDVACVFDAVHSTALAFSLSRSARRARDSLLITVPTATPVAAAMSAYPWNAVSPTSDSTVNVVMPGNLREADRAYYNYAVMLMRVVRSQDPDGSCEALVEAEEKVLSSYVDGWIVARTLFGGPAFAPMDELVFAREASLLRPLLAARGNTSIGVCADEWATDHPDEITSYESWRAEAVPDLAKETSEPAASEDLEPKIEAAENSDAEASAES